MQLRLVDAALYHPEHRRARCQAHQLGVAEPGVVDLDDIVGGGHLHAVHPGERLVQGALAEVQVDHAAGVPWRPPRGEQRQRLAIQQREPAQAPCLLAAQGQRDRDLMRGTDELAAQHKDGRVQARAAHRIMEAAQDLDLLDQLAVTSMVSFRPVRSVLAWQAGLACPGTAVITEDPAGQSVRILRRNGTPAEAVYLGDVLRKLAAEADGT